LVAIVDCLVSSYSRAFHEYIRYFQLPSINYMLITNFDALIIIYS